MPKYYKKKYYYSGSRNKYSVHQSAGSVTTLPTTGKAAIDVVNFSPTEGMRKVKNLTISMVSNFSGQSSSALDDVYWALVYVPEGNSINPLNVTNPGSMYEPNQYVMSCGIMNFSSGPNRIYTPLARNLNNGDRIVLVLKDVNPSGDGTSGRTYNYVVRYAITLH